MKTPSFLRGSRWLAFVLLLGLAGCAAYPAGPGYGYYGGYYGAPGYYGAAAYPGWYGYSGVGMIGWGGGFPYAHHWHRGGWHGGGWRHGGGHPHFAGGWHRGFARGGIAHARFAHAGGLHGFGRPHG